MKMIAYKTIDAYIKSHPKKIQATLQSIRKTIVKSAPGATEKISYGMPTFILGGVLVHFAAYETHFGFYPGSAAIVAFASELKKYDTAKGTIRFPLDKKVPLPLIEKITKYRAAENLVKAARKNPGGMLPKVSAPASRAFASANIKTLRDLSKWTEKDLLKLHGVGPSIIPILKKALREKGWGFKK